MANLRDQLLHRDVKQFQAQGLPGDGRIHVAGNQPVRRLSDDPEPFAGQARLPGRRIEGTTARYGHGSIHALFTPIRDLFCAIGSESRPSAPARHKSIGQFQHPRNDIGYAPVQDLPFVAVQAQERQDLHRSGEAVALAAGQQADRLVWQAKRTVRSRKSGLEGPFGPAGPDIDQIQRRIGAGKRRPEPGGRRIGAAAGADDATPQLPSHDHADRGIRLAHCGDDVPDEGFPGGLDRRLGVKSRSKAMDDYSHFALYESYKRTSPSATRSTPSWIRAVGAARLMRMKRSSPYIRPALIQTSS